MTSNKITTLRKITKTVTNSMFISTGRVPVDLTILFTIKLTHQSRIVIYWII